MSSFTWLNHDEGEAQRFREALAAFNEQGTVDPLGFGPVRDAFSDMLFPGISTVQTRARYFLFVPWIFRRLDEHRVGPADAPIVAKQWEIELIESLLRGSTEHGGIIGRSSRSQIKQVPSFVYWGGLSRWDIRRFKGSRQDYYASLGSRSRYSRGEDESEQFTPWHPSLPDEEEGFLEETTLELPAEEAHFLRERILTTCPETFLSLLVRDGRPEDIAEEPWLHPLAAEAPSPIDLHLHHGRLFAITTYGAGQLFNAEVSRLLKEDGAEPFAFDYLGEMDVWRSWMEEESEDLSSWDRSEFWDLVLRQNPRISTHTRAFGDWWLNRAIREPIGIENDPEVLQRLRHREGLIKGSRAKLLNLRARQGKIGPQGDGLMRFRWRQGQDIIRDILIGIQSGA